MIKIIQGESFPITVGINRLDKPLTPDNVADVAVCVGGIEKKHSNGSLPYDPGKDRWIFLPLQDETRRAMRGLYPMWITIKHSDGTIRKYEGSKVQIIECDCKVEL